MTYIDDLDTLHVMLFILKFLINVNSIYWNLGLEFGMEFVLEMFVKHLELGTYFGNEMLGSVHGIMWLKISPW